MYKHRRLELLNSLPNKWREVFVQLERSLSLAAEYVDAGVMTQQQFDNFLTLIQYVTEGATIAQDSKTVPITDDQWPDCPTDPDFQV